MLFGPVIDGMLFTVAVKFTTLVFGGSGNGIVELDRAKTTSSVEGVYGAVVRSAGGTEVILEHGNRSIGCDRNGDRAVRVGNPAPGAAVKVAVSVPATEQPGPKDVSGSRDRATGDGDGELIREFRRCKWRGA